LGPPPLLPGPNAGSAIAAGASAPSTASVVNATPMRFFMSFSSMDAYYGASTRRRTYLRALRAWESSVTLSAIRQTGLRAFWEQRVAPFCGLNMDRWAARESRVLAPT